VFDDIYEHEVWNDSDGVRVVLFLDVKRPLRGVPRLVNEAVIALIRWSPLVQDARLRQEAWERRTWPARDRCSRITRR
jgi:beta-hydroxylase